MFTSLGQPPSVWLDPEVVYSALQLHSTKHTSYMEICYSFTEHIEEIFIISVSDILSPSST